MSLEKWKRVGRRLVQMDRKELLVRVKQEFGKRQDGLLAHGGFDFARNVTPLSSRESGKFFFGGEEVPQLLALLRQRVPGQAERIIAQAEKILRHRFDLLGYQDLDYGSPIDWHLDAVHGKRAPRKLFYRVGYLDFQQVGDSKITWELNRHQHLVTLAKAFRLTGDHRFADEILRQWRHWWAENPYPMGINWASSLEAAFRSMAWLWTYHLLKGAPDLPDIRSEWLRGLALHGRHIERYLSTYFSPNTHLLGEGVGLFFLGVLCPELASAARWKKLGLEIVLRESERQVWADGMHFEQSVYYHVYALDFFLHFAVLASVNNISLPEEFERRLEKMLSALRLISRGGSPPSLGDDDGGRLFDPRRNRREHLLDPLAAGAVLFHRGDFKTAAAGLREETLWLLGAEGVRAWDDLEAAAPAMESAALPESGLYLFPVQSPPAQLVVDAGPLGTQSGGHGHADALSVTLQSQGRTLLMDPGTYVYVGDGPERDRFRGTALHNTVRVDGLNQAEISGPFAWQRLTQAKAETWIQGHSFDLLAASHDGYQRLPQPVTHRRWVVSLKNGIYLVRDVVEGQGKHQLDVSWHLGADLQLIEEGVFRVKGASNGLALLPAEGHGWAEETRRESWSPAYGLKMTTTALKFGTVAELPAEFAVLLVTLEEAHQRPGVLTRIAGQQADSTVKGYRFIDTAAEYSFYFAKAGHSWQHESVSSDAEFVCSIRQLESGDRTLILGNGSFAHLDGAELRSSKAVAWCELHLEQGHRNVFSSDPEAMEPEAMKPEAMKPEAVEPKAVEPASAEQEAVAPEQQPGDAVPNP